LGRINNTLWLEHATTEHTLSAHPSFQGTNLNGIEYAVHRECAKNTFVNSSLKALWEAQDVADKLYDQLIDSDRILTELIVNHGGRLDHEGIIPGTPSPISSLSTDLDSDSDNDIYWTPEAGTPTSTVVTTPDNSPILGQVENLHIYDEELGFTEGPLTPEQLIWNKIIYESNWNQSGDL